MSTIKKRLMGTWQAEEAVRAKKEGDFPDVPEHSDQVIKFVLHNAKRAQLPSLSSITI